MVGIYKTTIGIFDKALQNIQNGMFEAGANLFNNTFMNLAFSLTVMYIGFLIIFQKIKTEETLYKLIWLVCIFAIVKGILAKQGFYTLFIEIVNAPAHALWEMVTNVVKGANKEANLENVVEILVNSLKAAHAKIQEQSGFFQEMVGLQEFMHLF